MQTPSALQKLESMLAGLRLSGLGLSAISKQAGVTRTTLWRIEVGEARQPSAETFAKIERVYIERIGGRE